MRITENKTLIGQRHAMRAAGYEHTVTDLINALPGNSSVNTVQHATIEEVVFSVYPTDAPIYWLDSDHVICMSVQRLYNKSEL
jgi:hypothetical protein